MATLLGTANLTTTASTSIDAVSLVTDDLTKSTSTGFRRPIAASILDPGNIPAGTGQSDERPLFREETDKFLALGYFDDDYISGDAESVDIIDGVIYCAYDFLEIDPTATVANVQVRLNVKSTVGSGTDRGNIRVQWAQSGKPDTNLHQVQSGPTTLTDGELTTLNFTITPDGTQWDGVGMGANPLLRINFQEGGASKSGCFLFSARAQVNYTGRTRFTTGYQTPSSSTGGVFSNDINPYVSGNQNGAMVTSTGYGFAVPSGHTVDGVALRFGAVGTERNSNQIWGPMSNNTFKFKDAVGGTLVTLASPPVDDSMFLDGVEGSHATLYSSIDDENNIGLTTAEANNTNLTLESRYLITSGTSENLKQPFVADVNLAHVGPIISGDIGLSTVSTTTVGAVLTHAVASSEIATFASTFTTTALGGFVLVGAPQTQASAFTTTVGTAGRIRTNHTVSMPTAFGVTVSAINDITGSALSFPTATVTVSSGVTRTTPATSSSAFTTTVGTAGMTRTDHTIASPVVAAMASVSQVALIKATATDRIFVADQETRTHLIDTEIRTHTIEQQTRTHQIDTEVRTITVDQQTRTADVEGM